MSLGASFWLPPLVLLGLCAALFVYWLSTLKHLRPSWSDLRFFIVPIVIFGTGFLTHYHLISGFYDQAYHLQISNRILDRWTWEPTHQGMSYSFRPEIVSGIAAIELWLTGEVSVVYFAPTLLLASAAWSIQHVGEHFSNPRWGFIAGAVFCLLPVTVMFGRTMLLDTAVAGMLVSVFHHLQLSPNASKTKHGILGVLSAIVGLTKYPYLYLGGYISLVYLIRKRTLESKYIACGYFAVVSLFLLKNQLHTGWILGPLQSQITGTVASATAIAADSVVYSPRVFLTDIVAQWDAVLFCVALYGGALVAKRKSGYVSDYWLLLLPAIVLHGYVLNFGWIRYSTPWLALLCVGIPAAIVHSAEEFGATLHRIRAAPILVGVLLLTSVGPMINHIEEIQPRSEVLYEVRGTWAAIYSGVGSDLQEGATIVTGRDITMGLYSQTPCFRYEDQNYSMLQAINKFDPTHVFTQDSQYRYDIDINSTFLFGSPIEPAKVFSADHFLGRLWSVNDSRLEQADWWRNSTVEINGEGAHYGDFLWVANGSTFELLDHTSVRRILQTDGGVTLGETFDVLTNDQQRLLCNSVADCSIYDRTQHLQEHWAVWMVNTSTS